ncbi:MAG: hypothetical protein A2622_08415 [Bdellovibrionales bacterium RIFCSPHIGHO2_01_FULL_40_29]|nr:MAG: hypothetical protein A2622_08415 [Bdellovibrionales bacterium RIFCSPHIGHO2_01_FULL_40_29]OFZ35516.1 MAG: hypothetical protein A3D17_07650 [Bdellovibrionales bacterium RIFCSPHIGHO2_02_FULL_40_15]
MKKQLRLSGFTFGHQFQSGGLLRNTRRGRRMRSLSTKEPLHLVFKVNRQTLKRGLRSPRNFALITTIITRYAKHFSIRLEQVSIQNDHLHCLIRASHRHLFQNFFRVVAGQIAQRIEMVTDTPNSKKLWKYRPFSRVVRGYNALKIVRDYIQLNELEALGVIKYNKKRLCGLSTSEWEILSTKE